VAKAVHESTSWRTTASVDPALLYLSDALLLIRLQVAKVVRASASQETRNRLVKSTLCELCVLCGEFFH